MLIDILLPVTLEILSVVVSTIAYGNSFSSSYYTSYSTNNYTSYYNYSRPKYLLSAVLRNALNSFIKALFKAIIIAYSEVIYFIKKLNIAIGGITTSLIKESRIDKS